MKPLQNALRARPSGSPAVSGKATVSAPKTDRVSIANLVRAAAELTVQRLTGLDPAISAMITGIMWNELLRMSDIVRFQWGARTGKGGCPA